MSTHAHAKKKFVWQGLDRVAGCAPTRIRSVADALFQRDVICHISHPINDVVGIEAMVDQFWLPLKTACPDLERRDDIIVASSSDDFHWVAATGYYYGTLVEEWLGIPATHNWIAIRYGEFYRLEADRIVEMYCIIDFVDLMRQAGIRVLPPGLGVESLVPPPASHDGCTFSSVDGQDSLHTQRLVEAMIFDGLLQFDGKTSTSIGMERYWHPDMMWYGPGGIGTTRGLSGFMQHHQEPFQNAFPDWKGEIPLSVAEGHFMAAGGWPSIHCTHSGVQWLGMQPTYKRLSMRVMDWWRRDGQWLKENWVFIDIPHIFLQFGIDMFGMPGMRTPDAGRIPAGAMSADRITR